LAVASADETVSIQIVGSALPPSLKLRRTRARDLSSIGLAKEDLEETIARERASYAVT
jgi:hypothetical protein